MILGISIQYEPLHLLLIIHLHAVKQSANECNSTTGFQTDHNVVVQNVSHYTTSTPFWFNRSIWPTYGSLTYTTTVGQCVLGSNVNEGVLHILQGSGTGASPSDAV